MLGELYKQALAAEGFSVQLNQNIGTTSVTMQALEDRARSAMYPEYLNIFNTQIAGTRRRSAPGWGPTGRAQRYARRARARAA